MAGGRSKIVAREKKFDCTWFSDVRVLLLRKRVIGMCTRDKSVDKLAYIYVYTACKRDARWKLSRNRSSRTRVTRPRRRMISSADDSGRCSDLCVRALAIFKLVVIAPSRRRQKHRAPDLVIIITTIIAIIIRYYNTHVLWKPPKRVS